MFERLKQLFRDEESIKDPEISVPMAAAMLLLEVAWADHQISAAELTHIKQALKTLYHLDTESIEELIQSTRTAHEDSTGLHPFTRKIVESLDRSERLALLEKLWLLALSDEVLAGYEEHTIRKISELMYLSHNDFIQTKLAVKKQLGQSDVLD